MCENLFSLGGFFSVIGIIVCGLIVFCFLGWVSEQIPNMFPAWRAERARKRFEKGVRYGRMLIAGAHDDDVRKRLGIEGELFPQHRVRYGQSMLEESRYMNRNDRDKFDDGVGSVLDGMDDGEEDGFIHR